jgi:hypothetical protein
MLSDMVYPFWHLWYLASLVAWRILSPYWAHLRHPVTAAIILSTLDGFHSPYKYSTQRTTYYFPYFMLGIVIRQDGCVSGWKPIESRRRIHTNAHHPHHLLPTQWCTLTLCTYHTQPPPTVHCRTEATAATLASVPFGDSPSMWRVLT